MEQQTINIMHECAIGSHAGTLNFPAVVQKLTAAGVEQYHADFQRAETTYYLPTGQSHIETLPLPSKTIATDFDADAVAAAVKAAQSGLLYKEFLLRVFAAGCIGYFVYIEGQRVVYLGRRGDMHIEYFPGSAGNSA